MRRKDREMNRAFGEQIIDKAPYGVLSAVTSEGTPYALPLSIARRGANLYFHSARAGKKVEVYRDATPVEVVFVGHVAVPELYSAEELAEMEQDTSRALELTRRVFTTEYESAIAKGMIYEVTERAEMIEALCLICQKYTPTKMALFPSAVEAGLPKVRIYRIEIQSLTAKRKRYDSLGEELKYGRKEL